jgi:hypothetical protein
MQIVFNIGVPDGERDEESLDEHARGIAKLARSTAVLAHFVEL